MRVKEKSETAGLKLNIKKMKIVTSYSISSWETEGEKVEAVTDFIFLDSKITLNGDCSHEIKTLAPWEENDHKMRQCIEKQRRHFSNKGPYSQSYGLFL